MEGSRCELDLHVAAGLQGGRLGGANTKILGAHHVDFEHGDERQPPDSPSHVSHQMNAGRLLKL